MNKTKNTLLLCILGFLFFSCSSKQKSSLKNGDLLFTTAKPEDLSGAIDRVTQTGKTTHYSHILLEKKGDSMWVLHAGRQGSERINFKKFLSEQWEKGNQIDVYRLKQKYQQSIPKTIFEAKTWLEKPYNYDYVLSDTALYCSDFIQRSFVRDSIFKLKPMTFKDPKTGKTDSVWIDYYEKLGLEIPEGKPGCNPNGMAASSKIKKVETITNEGAHQKEMIKRDSTYITDHLVVGANIDKETRCQHYHSDKDVIALKFPCCNIYYSCYKDHEKFADHSAKVWKKDQRDKKAVLCGVCGYEMTINEYLNSNNSCPNCTALYNPGCEKHYQVYFEI